MEGDDHSVRPPVNLEHLVVTMTEMEKVLGDAGKPIVAAVRQRVGEAMAARDRGDPAAMLEAISQAMSALGGLGDVLGPQEGQLIDLLAQRFKSAMLRGDTAEAKRDMDVMFERSGARYRGQKE